jgi:hypothetical protein
MGLTVKVEPIDRDVAVMLAEDLSPAARSATLAEFARQALADAEATNEAALSFDPPFDTFVDGSQGKSEDQVSPDGVIVYQFKLVNDIIEWVRVALEESSPIGSKRDPHPGLYQRSHELYADGSLVDGDEVPPASEYVFLNITPYARKIEQGESPQFPDGVYEGVAAVAASKFGNIAKIEFTYRGLISGVIFGKSGPRPRTGPKVGRKSSRPAAAQNKADIRQPAIVIRPY